MQFNLTLPAGLSTGTVTAGSILTAAAKSVSTNFNAGTWTFIVFGLNQNAIAAGSLLTAQVTIANGTAAGILGMAFKAESDDSRASLSFKLRRLLAWAGARVVCTDPYVRDPRLTDLETVLRESEILILGVPHRAYLGLPVGGRDIVDIWGALGRGIRL